MYHAQDPANIITQQLQETHNSHQLGHNICLGYCVGVYIRTALLSQPVHLIYNPSRFYCGFEILSQLHVQHLRRI